MLSKSLAHLSLVMLSDFWPKYAEKKSEKLGTVVAATMSYGFLPGKGGLNRTALYRPKRFTSGWSNCPVENTQEPLKG